MSDPLLTYVCDHLAGARLAVGLLKDLGEQTLNPELADFAASLAAEIETDKESLEEIQARIGPTSPMKEFAGWMAQKASLLKLRFNEPLGLFEAIEMLCLGVLGKQALWKTLQLLSPADGRIGDAGFQNLISLAELQHQRLEEWRLKLALAAFDRSDSKVS